MSFVTVLFTGFALSLDAFSVAIASGSFMKNFKFINAFKISFHFGFFQAMMPVIGWLAGSFLKGFIEGFEKPVSSAILFLIGIKMIYESYRRKGIELNPSSFFLLISLSIATSLDALAVGVTFSFLKIKIILPSIMIGLITFSLSFLGVLIGVKLSHFFEEKIGFLSGLILILIGVKILIQSF
ncbi:MAG TPA: manganese efflux pump [Firmicutes bacterium]|nr:MAG: hypothetical protein DRP67_01700 [Candidatus Omnitrophota bacterium]HDD64859.1 manganese efflux pump [Bacillota bacterium]